MVIDVPDSPAFDPLDAYDRNPSNPQYGTVMLSEYSLVKNREQLLFDSLSDEYNNVHIIDTSIDLCNKSVCSGGSGNTPWYRDRDHLTDAGANVTKVQFIPLFMKEN